MGEDMVVEALRAGAHDYVLKGNLQRLVPAVQRELREAGSRAAARRAEAALSLSEARYRNLVESIPAAVYVDEAIDDPSALYHTRFLSPQIERILGYAPEEFERDPELWWSLIHPDDRPRIVESDRRHYEEGVALQEAFRMVARDGHVVWVLDQATIVNPEGPGPRVSQGILMDFTERKRQEDEINRIRTELAQIMSHELFTPITSILGTAATLSVADTRLSDEELRGLAEGVKRAATRLRRLVANIGAVAILDPDTVRPTGTLTLGWMIEHAVAEFADDRAEMIEVRAPTDVLERSVRANPSLVPRALVLVTENALDFGEGSPVVIEAAVDGDEIRIEVSDRGPGIPPDQRERIFELFTQADGTNVRSHEGLGIGLFLARRIMEAHGGRLEFREREGGGATFVLVFLAGEVPPGP
jgi:PAS domain S-box-containing protein